MVTATSYRDFLINTAYRASVSSGARDMECIDRYLEEEEPIIATWKVGSRGRKNEQSRARDMASWRIICLGEKKVQSNGLLPQSIEYEI